jgi:hypothetical protein
MIYQHSTTEDDRRIADATNDKIKMAAVEHFGRSRVRWAIFDSCPT